MNTSRPTLNRNWIDPMALRIIESLQKHGHQAFLVGGCVRDLLLGIHPKDFDIATSARPEEVKRRIPSSYIIGRRFKLVLVKRNQTQYEIATFRRNKGPEDDGSAEEISGDNYFGSQEEDALRRDFSINSLFFDPIKDTLIDVCKGLDDIQNRELRMIGSTSERLIEDPIRTLRAIRLSQKLNIQMVPSLKAGIAETREHLKNAILPRKREEYLKILKLPHPENVFLQLFDLGALEFTLPWLHQFLLNPELMDSYLSLAHQLEIVFPAGVRSKWDNKDLFLFLLFPIINSLHTSIRELDQSLEFNHFLKDELGVFKQEMSDIYRTLSLIPILTDNSAYLRKGPRRKQSFMSQDGLLMALELSYLSNSMRSSEYYFWLNELNNYSKI